MALNLLRSTVHSRGIGGFGVINPSNFRNVILIHSAARERNYLYICLMYNHLFFKARLEIMDVSFVLWLSNSISSNTSTCTTSKTAVRNGMRRRMNNPHNYSNLIRFRATGDHIYI